jgi:predicted HTH transcriptional regulator
MEITANIGSKEEALAFVNKVGECTLFPTSGFPDLYSHIEGKSSDEKRNKAWNWSDELNLEKRLFLSLAIKGRVTMTSMRNFEEKFRERSKLKLKQQEVKLLELVRKKGAQSSPRLREFSCLNRREFDRVLKSLRRMMLIAIVGIQHKSKTKYVYVYDLTERSVPLRR